ncbi:MAG: hypothetical protein QOF40_744 [Actinomycetota bacterium]|nr:hypothetical protein [Actinomycetota bacterium]
MRTRLRIVAAWCGVIALAGFGTGGCGGDGGRLSAPGYVREASGICSAANRAVRRVEIPPLHDPRSVARAVARVVVIERHSIDGLRALKPPERLGSLSQQWIALLDQGTDELERMRTMLKQGRSDQATAYEDKASTLLDRAHVLASAHELTSCRGPSLEGG